MDNEEERVGIEKSRRREWGEEGEEGMGHTNRQRYFSQPKSGVLTSIGINIQRRSLTFGGKEGSLVKHITREG